MAEDLTRQSISAVYEETISGPNPIGALLRRYVPGRILIFGVAVFSSIIWRLLKLVPPYLLGIAVDGFFARNQRPLSVAFIPQGWIPVEIKVQFIFVMGLFLAVALATRISQGSQIFSWRWFQQSVLHELRQEAYDATQRLDMTFFESEQTGDVMSVLNNDVNQLESFLKDGLQNIIQTGAFFPGLLLIMLGLHWQLTLVALAFVPLTIGVAHIYQRVIEPRYDARRVAVGTLNSHIQNAISGIETIKSYTNEQYEQSRLKTNSRNYWQADWNAAKIAGIYHPARGFITNAAMITILVIGGWWALFGPLFGFGEPLSGGTFVTFYFYASMFVAQASRIGDIVDNYVDAKASAKRVFGLIHHPSTVPEADDAFPLETVQGHISYHDVTFTYPSDSRPALQNVEFEVTPKDFVGLVGPTGAGKSTVLKLLLRFYDPDTGSITIDGVDITDVTVKSLREAIGYVSQDPFLFDGTVQENIAYDLPEADKEAIISAAKRANAHEFIVGLPESYETEVGERGVKLSGGQRQRIAIARAILKDPEILLLDEATSHVDNRTELLIQESLTDLIAGRTTIAIAHQLSTIRDADEILVFDDGEIVECGTHDELLGENGLYADLWNIHIGEVKTIPEV